jgi:hypothetical protein
MKFSKLGLRKFSFIFLCLVVLAVLLAIPAVSATQYAGEMYYDSNLVSGFENVGSHGYVVYYPNNETITINGIRLFGCKFGENTENAVVTVMIWDDNLDPIFKENVSYSDLSLNTIPAIASSKSTGSWAEIPVPDLTVNQNFYVAVFPHSDILTVSNDHGIRIGFSTPSMTHTSHIAIENPNAIRDSIILINITNSSGQSTQQYTMSDIDWKIRVHYTPGAAFIPLGLIEVASIVIVAVIGGVTYLYAKKRKPINQ